MRAWVLAALLLAPLALADHVYSHRFVFEGRVVDADGLPVPGRTLAFFAEGDDFLEPCAEGLQPTTDAHGDFRFCYHKHDLKASATVGVRVDGVTVRKPMDTGFRRTVVLFHDPNATGAAPPGWNDTFRLAGRVWRTGPTTLEGVPVFGLALANVPVNVTLTTPDGGATSLQVVTDGHGDFDATLRLVNGAGASNVTVEVEALGKTLPVRLDTTFHRNTVGFLLPREAPEVVVASGGASGEMEDASAPGAGTPRVTGLLLGVVGCAALVALAVERWKRA
jgi:hypothetical protein